MRNIDLLKMEEDTKSIAEVLYMCVDFSSIEQIEQWLLLQVQAE